MGISPISLLISIGQRAQENQCWCKDTKKVDATTNYTNFFLLLYKMYSLPLATRGRGHLPLDNAREHIGSIIVTIRPEQAAKRC